MTERNKQLDEHLRKTEDEWEQGYFENYKEKQYGVIEHTDEVRKELIKKKGTGDPGNWEWINKPNGSLQVITPMSHGGWAQPFGRAYYEGIAGNIKEGDAIPMHWSVAINLNKT